MFIDEVVVTFKAGKGGDGAVSWRREKYIPKGGPFGGNGGSGGSVILVANENINTLSEFRHKKVIKADSGIPGATKEMNGAAAPDLMIEVPVGTIVTDQETGDLIIDLSEPGEMYLLCQGGRGWYGNAHFTSSTRQAPAFAELGDVGEERTVKLELKLVADIGIIGLPNAGKSTLIQSITNVRPKIANYAFTTLTPNLGVMDHKGKSLVIEDVPGLIPGASEGKGLGIQFLKHVERTRTLLHLLDLSEEDKIVQNYLDIRKELELFSEDLAKKEEIIVLSKADLYDSEMVEEIQRTLEEAIGKKKMFIISAASYQGIDELKDYLIKYYSIEKKVETEEEKEMKVYDLKWVREKSNEYSIKRVGPHDFVVSGERIEQIVRMTNMQNFEAVSRVYDILDKMEILTKVYARLESDEEGSIRSYFFEGNEDEEIAKITIAGRAFPLSKTIFKRKPGK